MIRPSCDQFSFSRLEKDLQIWECNVSKDDAIATVVDKLDTKSAPTLPKPEECYNYVLEEIREEEIREMEEAQGKKKKKN